MRNPVKISMFSRKTAKIESRSVAPALDTRVFSQVHSNICVITITVDVMIQPQYG